MSGTGGGGWDETHGTSCDRLTSETTLTSPDRTVVALLAEGDVLTVEIDDSNARPVVRAIHKGKVAGSITSSIIQRIAECIAQGYNYEAKVLSVNGGACKVRVYARG